MKQIKVFLLKNFLLQKKNDNDKTILLIIIIGLNNFINNDDIFKYKCCIIK